MKRMPLLVYLLALSVPTALFADTVSKQETGASTVLNGASSNYQFNAEVGAPGAGRSSSTNYIYDHGMFWGGDTGLTALIQWLIPYDTRATPPNPNYDSEFYLTFTPTGGGSSIRIPQDTSSTLRTSEDGTYLTPIDLSAITPGNYDVYVKTSQHLRKKLSNIAFTSGETTLNFTQSNNSSTYGTGRIIGGDVNPSPTPGVFGDNTVNANDISIVIGSLNVNDATGNAYRGNINQDTTVNANDISIVVQHLNETGD